MIVTQKLLPEVIHHLSQAGQYGFDTETTGLNAYKGDRLFSAIIADSFGTYYFNFQSYDGMDPLFLLPRSAVKDLQIIFNNSDSTWFIHNAKFDMSFLAMEGIEIFGKVHCTQSTARLEYNAHWGNGPYSLASCVKRIGLEKSNAVDGYIDKHGLWEWEQIPGKKSRSKRRFYNLVPFEIIQPYGEQDAKIVRVLGVHQLKKLEEIDNVSEKNWPRINGLYDNETRLTKTCFKIERVGVQIDRGYCERAVEFETQRYQKASQKFEEICGIPFIDSNKALERAFNRVGIEAGQTLKGNPSFTEDVLSITNHPLATTVLEYREAYKRANTYFRNYLYFSDQQSAIHANIKQAGTETGRFSYGDPNLQNVPKRGEENQEFPVRRALIPREGYFFAMLDYDQMEYRLMVDYAGEKELIEKIKGGLDVHTACAEIMGIQDREQAKTTNFQNLYGGGDQKLSLALDISLGDAKSLRNKYWDALPKVESFIKSVISQAKNRGYIFNWFGRRCYFPKSEFAYAAPNHLIQGGCADIVKIAMNQIDEFLEGKKSRMLIQVHDEILLEIHESEKYLVADIRMIMEEAYPAKHLNLTCSVEHSHKSWFDKIEGLPS